MVLPKRIGTWLTCLALCVSLAGLASQPSGASAAGQVITVTPGAGPAGSTFTVRGSGFSSSTVAVYFAGAAIGSAAVYGGTVDASFQVPNVPPNTYAVALYSSITGYSESAPFSVTGATSPTGPTGPTSTLGNLIVSKYVQTNSGYSACSSGSGCSTQNMAGNTITYAVQYQNTANQTVSQLTIVDTIQPGQTVVSASTGCAPGPPSGSLATVICTINNVPAAPLSGSVGSVSITTQPVTSFSGVITNQACATEYGFVGQACSNTTYVTVNGTGTVGSTTQLCGTVSAYVPPSLYSNSYGSVTIGGQTFSIAPNAQMTGVAISTLPQYSNVCIQFTFVNSIVTALNVTSNLAAVNEICGVLSVYSYNTFTVGGMNYPVAPSVYSGSSFVPQATYCFLIQNGTIVGVLSGIPTAAYPVARGSHLHSLMIPN